jgi:cell division protease FtsH
LQEGSGHAKREKNTVFKSLLYADHIDRVLISDTAIRGTLWEGAVEPGRPRVFTTAKVEDPGLIEELETRGVTFSGQYRNPWLETLLGWIVPVLLFAGNQSHSG